MTTEIIDLADIDCIFLTYDEPKKEEFWAKVNNMIPWAKRVDGVVGTDQAHKAAAELSETERFLLIDGDNIPDSELLDVQLRLIPENKHKVFRWKSRNFINGLQYGNGGVSCWTREFVRNMRTHEHSNGNPETAVEFCFDPDYWAMHDCYSTTYPNGSAFQAWRAGFREGVKLCLDRGIRPTLSTFHKRVHPVNFDHLCIWHSVGADVEYGVWAMLGARTGTWMTMFTDWDYTLVHDFNELADIFGRSGCYMESENEINSKLAELEYTLTTQLNLPIITYDANQSRFFKQHFRKNYKNIGPMHRE